MIWTTARYLTPYPYSGESLVEGANENGNTETLPRNHRIFRQPEDGPEGYLARGGEIADYVAPPVPFKSLTRPAFLFMMSKIGVTEAAVEQLIAAMPESTEAEKDAKALAMIVFKNTTTFERNNQLLNTLTAAYGLTSEQVDASWRAAEQIAW